MTLLREFLRFLKEYNVVALAIGFMIGVAAKDLVTSFVNNILMPFVEPFVAAEQWQNATFFIGPVQLKWGAFLATAIDFTIIALVVFLVVKKILKEEHVEKL